MRSTPPARRWPPRPKRRTQTIAKANIPKVFTPDQITAFFAQIPTHYTEGLRKRLIYELMYRAGLRVGEVCELRPQDVNLPARMLELKITKGRRPRNVPICAELFAWLTAWEQVRPRDTATYLPVVRTLGYGNKTFESAIRHMTKKLLRAAGIPTEKRSPHTFRHTFATECLREGFDLEELRVLMGHSSINTTQIYLHVEMSDIAAKMSGRTGVAGPQRLQSFIEKHYMHWGKSVVDHLQEVVQEAHEDHVETLGREVQKNTNGGGRVGLPMEPEAMVWTLPPAATRAVKPHTKGTQAPKGGEDVVEAEEAPATEEPHQQELSWDDLGWEDPGEEDMDEFED